MAKAKKSAPKTKHPKGLAKATAPDDMVADTAECHVGTRPYRVGWLRMPLIITEIRRPEPEAVLVLRPHTVVYLTNGEIHRLYNAETGPLIPIGLLTPAEEAANEGGEKGEGGCEEGQNPEETEESNPHAAEATDGE